MGRAVPWWAVALTVLVIVTAALAVDPIRDAVTGEGIGEARLDASTGYLLLAPLSSALDALTLFTVGQHIAILLTAILLFALWRVRRARTAGLSARRELTAAGIFLASLFVTYAAMAYLPRPMATLVMSDETVLAVDFHSHTQYSHDGRRGWTEDDVRDWHRSAGYDVAYITDHATFTGAERGIASNPPVAGEGTMLLQGLEANFRGEHVNVLSAGRHFRGLTDPSLKDIDQESLTLSSLIPRRRRPS